MQRDNYQNALQERLLCELSQWTSEWDWRGATVLDVGSRYGHRTEQLAQRLAPLKIDSVRGIDSDVHGVEFATKNLADEKLEFSYIADFEDRLPLKYSQAFDWVFHINPTLFHLNNQEAALRNLLWCLKPSSGRLLLAIPCELPSDLVAATSKIILKKMGKQLNQWMIEALDVNKKTWYGHPNADRLYAHLMERVGFCIHRTKIMDFKYKFEHKNEHRASVESYFFDVIMSVTEEHREPLAKRLYSTASGSFLRRSLQWESRYVLVLASRMALTCKICYGPKNRAQAKTDLGEAQDDDVPNGDPPPLPVEGPPSDGEGGTEDLEMAEVNNEDLASENDDQREGDETDGKRVEGEEDPAVENSDQIENIYDLDSKEASTPFNDTEIVAEVLKSSDEEPKVEESIVKGGDFLDEEIYLGIEDFTEKASGEFGGVVEVLDEATVELPTKPPQETKKNTRRRRPVN